MKKGQAYEGTVLRTEFPNKGIVAVEGEEDKAIVKGALPGQRISFFVQKGRKGRAEGRLLSVLERSPLERREAPCGHFGECGGCAYQAIPYEEQLALKEAQARELLGDACGDGAFLGIQGSPKEWGYRNKMEFSFGNAAKGGPLTLGLHKKGSFHDIVHAAGCRIVDEDFTRVLECVHSYFLERGTSFYHRASHEGWLRHLLVRRAVRTGEMLVCLITSGQGEGSGVELPAAGREWPGLALSATGQGEEGRAVSSAAGSVADALAPLVERLLALPLTGRIVGILHMRNDSVADVVRSDETTLLYGQDHFYEEILGLRFKITPFSFFQTNTLAAEDLYRTVREFAGEMGDKVIYDLYCGTGAIAQVLAPVARKVVGVEIVEEAVRAARENAAGNGLSNCEFIAGDVRKVLDSLGGAAGPDIIVLDPPRDGVHPKALRQIAAFGAERILYISCKPTSLARDLLPLREAGYRVEKARCHDLFPQTPHVETVVLMSRVKD